MFTMRNPWIALTSMVLVTAPSLASADSFFSVTAAGSGGTIVSNSGGNILRLTDNLISFNGNFLPLLGQNVISSVSWGGVPNAIILTENSLQTQATLVFPSTGFARTFIGTNASDLQDQIHDFIQKDGERAYAQFLQSMNQLSAVASLDGNPQASTALISNDVFSRFGIENQQPTQTRSESGGAYFGIAATGGETRADDLNGNWVDLNFDTVARLGSNFALDFGTTLAYREVGSSAAYTVAEELALPVTLINNHGNGISWQVAPWAFAGLSASYDQAAGGVLLGGGGTSSLALHLGGFTLTLGDQISYTGNCSVTVDGYEFDTDIDQWILMDGLDARYQFPHTPIFIDGSIAYNNFLRKAAVPDYWAPSLGIGIAFGPNSSLRISYDGDFAKGYNDNGGDITLVLSY
jgi:putative lipoic acid-binding regulatory protein